MGQPDLRGESRCIASIVNIEHRGVRFWIFEILALAVREGPSKLLDALSGVVIRFALRKVELKSSICFRGRGNVSHSVRHLDEA